MGNALEGCCTPAPLSASSMPTQGQYTTETQTPRSSSVSRPEAPRGDSASRQRLGALAPSTPDHNGRKTPDAHAHLPATAQNGTILNPSPAPSGVQSPRMQQVAMDIQQVLKRYETSSEAKRKAFLDALTPVQRQEFFRLLEQQKQNAYASQASPRPS